MFGSHCCTTQVCTADGSALVQSQNVLHTISIRSAGDCVQPANRTTHKKRLTAKFSTGLERRATY